MPSEADFWREMLSAANELHKQGKIHYAWVVAATNNLEYAIRDDSYVTIQLDMNSGYQIVHFEEGEETIVGYRNTRSKAWTWAKEYAEMGCVTVKYW
jgi:hypothetical protein